MTKLIVAFRKSANAPNDQYLFSYGLFDEAINSTDYRMFCDKVFWKSLTSHMCHIDVGTWIRCPAVIELRIVEDQEWFIHS